MDNIIKQINEILAKVDTSHLDEFEQYLRRFLASMIAPEWQQCQLSQALLPTGNSVYVATLEVADSIEGGIGLHEPDAAVRVVIISKTASGELRICPPSPVQDETQEDTSEDVGQLSVGCMENIARAMLEASTIVQQSSLRKRHKRWICAQIAHACRHLSQMLSNG